MSLELPPLPNILRVACEAGGMDAVKRLVKAFGGKRMSIPHIRNCGDHHPLVVAGGRAVADAICKQFAAGHVEFPKADATLNMWVTATLLQEGKSLNDIVDALQITNRRARQLKKLIVAGGKPPRGRGRRRREPDPRQLDIEDLAPSPNRRR